MNRLRPNCDEAKAAAFAIRRFSAATFPSPTAKLHATHILKSPVQVSTLLTIDMVNLQRNHLKGLVSNKLPWDASLYSVDAPRQEPILLSHKDRTSSSLRLRYFDPRDLTSDGLYRSRATALANAELGYRLHERWRLSTEFLNLLNRCDHDIDYACTSRITPTATSAFTQVFHPGEPFPGQVRAGNNSSEFKMTLQRS